MKHFRLLLPLLILALIFTGCAKSIQEPYTYTQRDYTFTVDPESRTITQGENTYFYEMESNGSQTSYVIHYPNGATYHWTATETGGAGGWSETYDEETYIPGDILVSSLKLPDSGRPSGNPGIGLLLMGLGLINFFVPDLSFYLRYGWAVENASPSDAYITWARAGGAVAAVLGLLYCVI